MRTTTAISPAAAAKMVGKDKSTITRAVKAGELSAAKDDQGRLWIEPSELVRVFPDAPLHHDDDAPSRIDAETAIKALEGGAKTDAATDAHQWQADAIRRELDEMRRQRDASRGALTKEQDERDRERRQQTETIVDLRGRLDSSEEERRKATVQLTALLTDQTEKAIAAAVPAKRGWFGFGRRSA